HEDVAELVARLHTLGGAITGVEVTLGERLTEYSDTVVQLGRGLTANVSTYREGNERSVSELRRALADSEELLRAVLTKADDLAVGLAAVRSEMPAGTAGDSLVAELHAIREELAQLKRRIAVRAKASVIDDEQIATIVDQVRAAIDVRLPAAEIERVAEVVARRMTEAFEVVADDEPAAPAPEPTSSRGSK